jgi:hypothetical protein
MKLQEAYNIINNLKIETTKKSEAKIYGKFLHTLSQLKSREFTSEEIRSIESELDSLNLGSNPKNGKRHYKKALNRFIDFLKDSFSLTPKGYYTNMGIGLGSTFGMLFSIVFLSRWEQSMSLSLGWMAGMLIGLTIGRSMDARSVNEGRVV